MKIFVSFLLSCFCLVWSVAHAQGCPPGDMGIYLTAAPKSAGHPTFTITALNTGKHYHLIAGTKSEDDEICFPDDGYYSIYWDHVGKICRGAFQKEGACALTISSDRSTLSGRYAHMSIHQPPAETHINGAPCCISST